MELVPEGRYRVVIIGLSTTKGQSVEVSLGPDDLVAGMVHTNLVILRHKPVDIAASHHTAGEEDFPR